MSVRMMLGIALLFTLLLKPLWSAAAEPEFPNLWDAKERIAKPGLNALPRLRFLTTTDFPPLNFIDASGRLAGLHIELARAICGELGISERCQVQALPWDELEAALALGEGEAIIAGLAADEESRLRLTFTRPYLIFPARFVMNRTTAVAEPLAPNLAGKRVGVLSGTSHEQMLRDYFDDVSVVTYSKPSWLYEDLKAGKIAAVFGDGMRLGFWLAGSDSAGCCRFSGEPYLAPEYLGHGLSIAVSQENHDLASALDYALHEISTKGVFAELYLKYFPVSFF